MQQAATQCERPKSLPRLGLSQKGYGDPEAPSPSSADEWLESSLSSEELESVEDSSEELSEELLEELSESLSELLLSLTTTTLLAEGGQKK